jgi:outer membrane receptor protein involved in Fe transport
LDLRHAWGVQALADDLSPLGLYRTQQRVRLGAVLADRVQQQSLGLWAESELRWTDWLRTTAGVRGDAHRFKVQSNLAANSGQAQSAVLSPKLSVVLGPWRGTEFYANHGQGYHSNDARGTTQRVDPADPASAVPSVSPLVRTRGEEIGLRSEWLPGWKSTLALWQLHMASELLFVGDAGTTEPSRPSRRRGVEWNQFVALNAHWAIDADLAWSQARFTDGDPAGPYIPGAASTTANLGLSWDGQGPWSGALRLRYWGARPLVEDNSWRAPAAAWVNLRVGYRASQREQWALDVYNLLDRRVNDIEYAYVSRLPGEGAQGLMDRHVHPAEPRTVRLRWTHRF